MPRNNEEKRRAYDREWHKKNSAKRTEVQIARRKEISRWYREEIKPLYKCANCGEDDPIVIDFHHNDASLKTLAVSVMISQGFGRETILAEIAKCTPLCANCHRREEHRLRNTPL